MSIYRRVVRPLLFRLEAERAHDLALGALVLASRAPAAVWRRPDDDPRLERWLWGRRFGNPVGLAAGLDKRALALPAWAGLGFGFVEVGSITAEPQPGNPRPRLFRLPADEALINRLGFNNDGADATADRLAEWDRRGRLRAIPVGVNIGKSRVAPPERAAEDYAASLERLWSFADYVVVNVSSPNTPGLRDLQEGSALSEIIAALAAVNAARVLRRAGPARPLLVKLAPELSDAQLDAVVDLALARRLDGLVICNTTTGRPDLRSAPQLVGESGGLSGRPLAVRSTAMIRRAAARTGGRLPIIGVGGVFSAGDAWEKLTAGAALVQLYTGLVYGGPDTPRRICAGLVELMARAGVARLEDLPGAYHPPA